MSFSSSMLFKTDITTKLYHQLADLEEKLLKSETERKNLEMKFEYLARSDIEEKKKRTLQLTEKYNEFVTYCKESNGRNEKMLRSLERIETGANAVFAKTERLKQLRSHYNAYMARMPVTGSPSSLTADSSQLRPTSQRGRTSITISTNNAAWEPIPIGSGVGAGGATAEDLHAYSDGNLLSGSGLRRIGYGPIYVIPEKELSALENVMCRARQPPQTLGEAGKIMLKELNKHKSYIGANANDEPDPYNLARNINTSLEPNIHSIVNEESQRYPRYGLWPHVTNPPGCAEAFTYATPSSPCKLKTASKAPIVRSPSPNYWDDKQLPAKVDDLSSVPINKVLLSSPKSRFIHRDKSRDNFEIECLSADGNYVDEDHNLSDDEVLDAALNRSSVVGLDEASRLGGSEKAIRGDWEKYSTNENNLKKSASVSNSKNGIPRMLNQNDKTDDRTRFGGNHMPGIAGRIVLENDAKRSLESHKKSVDDLKAMLSLEDDEVADESNRILDCHEDEDIPEEFIEQPWSEDHYDPRYERDVSRNVILEEDEPDDNYEEMLSERRHERKDWRMVQQYKNDGKLLPQSGNYVAANETSMSVQEHPSSSGAHGENQLHPRMLTNAVNMFKSRRKSIEIGKQSAPRGQSPDTAPNRGHHQVVDKNQAPPTQRNAGKLITGLVEEERRRSPDIVGQETSSNQMPNVQDYSTGRQKKEGETAPKQKNMGNYLRGLAEREKARQNEVKVYHLNERQENPEEHRPFMSEQIPAENSEHTIQNENVHAYQQSGADNFENREQLQRHYDQQHRDGDEYFHRPGTEEFNDNDENGQEVIYNNENYVRSFEQISMEEAPVNNDYYEQPSRDLSNVNTLPLDVVYPDNQQRYEEYPPDSHHSELQIVAEYTEDTQFPVDRQGAHDNYQENHYDDQYQQHLLNEQGSLQREQYQEAQYHNGSVKQPMYQEGVGRSYQTENDYYIKGELEEQQQYPGQLDQYQNETIEYSEQPLSESQHFGHENEGAEYDTPDQGRLNDNNFRSDQHYYQEEKAQAEYEGLDKEQFQPENGEETIGQQEEITEANHPGSQVKRSVMAQLIDSESESYQVSAEPAPDDSDFDFSIGK